MSTTLTTVLLALCVSWGIWQLLSFIRSRIASAHLRRIKGPQSASMWTGMFPSRHLVSQSHSSHLLVGNLKQFYARGAAEWQRQLSRQYGFIVKLNGFLGVCYHAAAASSFTHAFRTCRNPFCTSPTRRLSTISSSKRRLYFKRHRSLYSKCSCPPVSAFAPLSISCRTNTLVFGAHTLLSTLGESSLLMNVTEHTHYTILKANSTADSASY